MKIKIISKLGRVIVKNAPKICIAIGSAGVVAGTVVACKETYAKTEEIEEAVTEFKEKDYIPAVKRFAKIYWPSALITGGSLFIIIGGHKILSKRYAGLVLAYEGLNASYKDYRSYISENYGENIDFAARHHIDGMALDADNDVVIAPEDIFIPDRDLSGYSVFFGNDYSLCIDSDDPEEALSFLKGQEEWANAVLQERGYIFLQEIYDGLGLVDKYAPDGLGWCSGIGDDYVDFGIFNVRNGRAVNGSEPVFLLDFNYDGYILPYI